MLLKKEDVKTLIESRKDGGTGNSNSLRREITQAMLNAPDYTQEVYTEESDGSMKVTETAVSANLRSEIAKTVGKVVGLDKTDIERATAEMQFSQGAAGAFTEFADAALMNYLSTGHKAVLPSIDKDMSRMGIFLADVDQTEVATRKIVKKEDGTYEQVATGEIVTTKKHTTLKSKCQTRPWHKVRK